MTKYRTVTKEEAELFGYERLGQGLMSGGAWSDKTFYLTPDDEYVLVEEKNLNTNVTDNKELLKED